MFASGPIMYTIGQNPHPDASRLEIATERSDHIFGEGDSVRVRAGERAGDVGVVFLCAPRRHQYAVYFADGDVGVYGGGALEAASGGSLVKGSRDESRGAQRGSIGKGKGAGGFEP